MSDAKEKPPGSGVPSGEYTVFKSDKPNLLRDRDQIKAHLIAELRNHIEEVARGELGDPTQRTKHELRYGAKGSINVKLSGRHRGNFYNFEEGKGGDPISLIMYARGCTFKDALKIGFEYVGGDMLKKSPSQRRTAKSLTNQEDPDRENRIRWARTLWDEAKPLPGTLGAIYLSNRGRDIDGLELDHCLKFHPGRCAMIARMTDPITNTFTGVHRTFLDGHGNKLDRRMLGGRGVIRLTPDEDVTMGLGIAEGIEDAIFWLRNGWPVWAVTCADAIRRFPVLAGIDALTIFADPDEPGMKAAHECASAWKAARRCASVVVPRRGK